MSCHAVQAWYGTNVAVSTTTLETFETNNIFHSPVFETHLLYVTLRDETEHGVNQYRRSIFFFCLSGDVKDMSEDLDTKLAFCSLLLCLLENQELIIPSPGRAEGFVSSFYPVLALKYVASGCKYKTV